jgi:signal transduction histidine kinase
MRLLSFENVRWYSLVLGLAAVLAVLAVLQYRSGKQVSDATTEQMRASLQGSLMDVRQGLERELTPLCRALQSASDVPRPRAPQEYLVRFEDWRRAAAHPDLVADIFVWQTIDRPHPQLLKLNSNGTGFETVNWPADFDRLRQRLQKMSPEFGSAANGPGTPDRSPDSQPGAIRSSQLSSHPSHEGSGPMDHYLPPQLDGHAHLSSLDALPSFSWTIDQDIPALAHSAWEVGSRSASGGPTPAKLSWIVVVLNLDVLEHHVLPELVERYFGRNEQSAYEIAVIGEDAHASALYSSDAGFGRQRNVVPDAALNLFGRPMPVMGGQHSGSERMIAPFFPPHQPGPVNLAAAEGPARRLHEEGLFRIEPIHYTPDEQDWEIIAKHRKGSVEAAVAALYHRNLAINFGVLLVLAATMGMIIATSQVARRLAHLQMDFVASVSHELRTPLTGIVSAAQNIADGLIDNREKMVRYGTAILGQAQQLTDLVEQILLFSATQKDRHRYHLQRVNVADVIDTSIKSTSGLIRSAGVVVQQEIEAGLPPVLADSKALSQCLQNLIANSVKYCGESRWIGIRASIANRSDGGNGIKISVEDKGIGISRADLDRIFEPFYRSPAVTAAQIHGSGLGLPLAKSIAEAMGGRLTVQSVSGKGSTFTVHLPVN